MSGEKPAGMGCISGIPATWKAEAGDHEFQASLSKLTRPCLYKGWECSSMVEHLPSMHKILGLIASIQKEKDR